VLGKADAGKPIAPATVLHSLSKNVEKILRSYDEDMDLNDGARLGLALNQLLANVEIIFDSLGTRICFVGKCDPKIAVKAVRSATGFTEYTTLQYLELYRPQLPIPRPHGVIVQGISAYIFQSLIPGQTLTQVWPSLNHSQKKSISGQLDRILLDLRGLELPAGTPLGGVANEGCKDVRRNCRVSERPLYSAADFWEFQYSEARASQVYRTLMWGLTEHLQASKCVFTHGDLRTDNILVVKGSDGSHQISGIVDWEMSGFYPEDFECTKVTNTLWPFEESDWYLYLPHCISPARYISRWLSDVVWDKQVV
jgi:Phosphotransferase enzyme family